MSVTLPADPVTTKHVVDNRRAVIRTVDLTKIYTGTVKAVDSLNLTVYQGEIFGLLGPNGAGKTTTASMLTTRTIPTHGQAFVGDVDVVVHPAIAKQLIGVVATDQHPRSSAHRLGEPVFPRSVLRHGSACVARGSRRDAPCASGSPSDAKAPVMALSGGLRPTPDGGSGHRPQPGRALPRRADCRFDPQSRIALWEILGELHTGGQTVLLTTHNMEEADSLCNRIGIMDHGRILALDTPIRLKETYRRGHAWSRSPPTVISKHSRRGCVRTLPACNRP